MGLLFSGMLVTRPSDFFALRTALLPFDEFLSWSEGLEASAALDNPKRLEQALAAETTRAPGGTDSIWIDLGYPTRKK